MEFSEKNEKIQYIGKLENQVQIIDNILALGSGSVIDLNTENKLDKLKKDAKLMAKKLKNDEYEVAIVGLEKAGKSTFANALMENNFLPTKDARCTFTSTRIEYNNDDRKDYANVKFFSKEEFEKDFKDKLKKLGLEDVDKYSFRDLSIEQYERLYNDKVSEDKKRLYSDTLNQDILSVLNNDNKGNILSLLGNEPMDIEADDTGIKRLERYITDPRTAYAVKEVIIKSKNLGKMKNAVIYDVPGFDSPTELHKLQTKQRMEDADAIIAVANGAAPSITGPALQVFRESDKEGNLLSDKLFVFANKIDYATKIKEDMKTTYDEWINNRRILKTSQENRIFFGSARARLNKIYPDDENYKGDYRKLEQLKDGDGIDAIRQALEAYNNNERFSVLKKRINKIDACINEILMALKEKYAGSTNYKSLSPEHQRAFGKFLNDSRKDITKKLEEYRQSILLRYYSEKPLSKAITDYICKNVTKENYSISDELVKSWELKAVMAGNQPVSKIENGCRDDMFTKMYTEDFSSNILSIADKHHEKSSNEILETIMSGMGVAKNSENYEKIKILLKQELSCFRKEFSHKDNNDESYNMYQSLIERFTRDIYELLIASNYNFERLERFYERIDNCMSMSVFYKENNEQNEFSYINVTPQNQPLWKMILFHSFAPNEDESKEVNNKLCDLVNVKELPEEFGTLIKKCISAAGGNVIKLVKSVSEAYGDMERLSKEDRIKRLKMLMEAKFSKNISYDISDKNKFREYYTKYHNESCDGEYTTEYVRKEFDKDIDILRDILTNCCVNAINLEKPFVAREVMTIDKIKNYINNNDKFIDFLSDHFCDIKYEETRAIDAKNARIEHEAKIANDINEYLEKLNF